MGWSDTHAVELALSSVTLAAAGCVSLVLCGEATWCRSRGRCRKVREPGRPFVVVEASGKSRIVLGAAWCNMTAMVCRVLQGLDG